MSQLKSTLTAILKVVVFSSSKQLEPVQVQGGKENPFFYTMGLLRKNLPKDCNPYYLKGGGERKKLNDSERATIRLWITFKNLNLTHIKDLDINQFHFAAINYHKLGESTHKGCGDQKGLGRKRKAREGFDATIFSLLLGINMSVCHTGSRNENIVLLLGGATWILKTMHGL